MSANYLGIRYTTPRRIIDNPILTYEEANVLRVEVSTNVKLWGAKGDGVTDDTQAFKDALANVDTCGIYVPLGVYIISSTLTVPGGKTITGECRDGSAIHFTGSGAGATAIILQNSSKIVNIRLLYLGSNFVDSQGILITGQNTLIQNIQMGSSDSDFAYGISFNTTSSGVNFGTALITDSRLNAAVTTIRYIASSYYNLIADNLIFVGTGGTAIDLANAGNFQTIVGNVFRNAPFAVGNALLGINVAVSSTIVGNTFAFFTTVMSGASLGGSMIMNQTTVVQQNITSPLNISGNQVVKTRIGGWATATGVATRTTFDTATVTLPQLAERVKALLDDLFSSTAASATSHGLIGP